MHASRSFGGMRWASLSPETTQWVQALGRSASLVGRSHLCGGSRSLEKLPICTRPGGEPTGWERYVGPYPPDFGVLSTLRPQGVLTLFPPLPPDLSEKELIALFQGAMGYPIRVFSASAHSWEEYEQLIHRLGEALPAEKKALRWLDHVRKRKERLLTRSRTIQHRQTIACLQPNGLPQLIGEWADILADFAGLSPLSAQTKTLPWEDLLKADPDIVVITLQGKNLSTTGEAVAAWARLPQVQGLSAFRKKKLYALQGTTGIFYPSPYTIYTAEALYELAYTPTYRYNRHIGRIWAPLL